MRAEPPAGYAIRDAREADLPLLGLLQEAARSAPDAPAQPPLPLAALDLCRAAGSLWLAVAADDRPVGYLAASESDGAMLILTFGVAHEHQRRGLGGALIDQALDQARWQFLPAAAVILDAAEPAPAQLLSRRGFVRLDPARAEPGLRQRLATRRQENPPAHDPCIMARLL
ncbi:MAG: GNAT family N-acetyltransferase [Salinarimonas sp.]